MTYSYDVVVIGAGVAGLNIAGLLGKYNLKVCLIDSKADFANASFHTLASFMDINHFGLSKNIIASDLTELYFHSNTICVRKRGHAHSIHKEILYKELLDKAVSNHVMIHSSSHIDSFTTDEKESIDSVVDNKGNIYKAKIFIDATGVEGFFSRHFGLLDKDLKTGAGLEYNVEYNGPQNQLHLFVGKLYQGGYAWLFPIGDNRAIFGFGTMDEKVRLELKQRLNAILETKMIKHLVKKDNDNLMGGTIPITNVKTKFIHKNIVCVGDSVSQINPIVGEGHKFIMEAGLIAAPYIQQAISKNNLELLYGYEKDWHKRFYNSYLLSKKLQNFADKVGKSDLLSDLATLFLATKRNKTFVNLISGEFTRRDMYLP